jgi:murein L,D-transpeptidase YafK
LSTPSARDSTSTRTTTAGPRFVADYYITHGKLGAEKAREGDKRTPVGVYHVTANLPRQKLSDFYGSGAFPISYPNEWDRQQGRDGHGIWLHGTPSDTYSRPPRASDGCVVLTNRDLDALSSYMQIGLTPVIISNTIEWLSVDDWASERRSLNREIEAWRKDWESRDVDRYLAHYSKNFRNSEGGYEQWARQKRLVSASKNWVKVDLGKLSVFRSPGKQDHDRRHLRAGLPQQQPLQRPQETPVLDQGRRTLEDHL